MELTQKDVDSAVEKKANELKAEFSKQLEAKDSEIAKMKTNLDELKEKSEKAEEESKVEVKDAEDKAEEAEKKTKEAEEALEKEKKAALEKLGYTPGAPADAEGKKQLSKEEVDKAFEEGKLPVMKID